MNKPVTVNYETGELRDGLPGTKITVSYISLFEGEIKEDEISAEDLKDIVWVNVKHPEEINDFVKPRKLRK